MMDNQASNRAETVARYADGPEQLEAAIAGLSDSNLDIAERGDTWTVRQIVHHIADGDALWKMFIQRAVGSSGGEFDLSWYWQMRQDEWAERWAYARREVGPSLALFRANRRHAVQLLAQLPQAWGQSLYITWPNGEEQDVTVAWVVEMQAGHVTGHVDDIRRARKLHGV